MVKILSHAPGAGTNGLSFAVAGSCDPVPTPHSVLDAQIVFTDRTVHGREVAPEAAEDWRFEFACHRTEEGRRLTVEVDLHGDRSEVGGDAIEINVTT